MRQERKKTKSVPEHKKVKKYFSFVREVIRAQTRRARLVATCWTTREIQGKYKEVSVFVMALCVSLSLSMIKMVGC